MVDKGYVTPIDSIGYKAANKALYQKLLVFLQFQFVREKIFQLWLYLKIKKTILMGFGLDSDAIHSQMNILGFFNYLKNWKLFHYFTSISQK